MRDNRIELTTIDHIDWLQRPRDLYELAANIALAGLDSFRGRLSAATQRLVFGDNIFGKREIFIDNTGKGQVKVRWSVCFGTDSDSKEFTFDELIKLLAMGRRERQFKMY